MRLTVLDRGHRRRVRLFLATVRRLSGMDMPDVVTMFCTAPSSFGRAAGSTGGPLAEPWQSYAGPIRDTPDRITGADVERLRGLEAGLRA